MSRTVIVKNFILFNRPRWIMTPPSPISKVIAVYCSNSDVLTLSAQFESCLQCCHCHKTTQWTLKSDFGRANLTTPSRPYLRSGHKIIWRKIPRSGRRHCGWRVGRLITFTFRPPGALSITIPIPYLPSPTPLSIARPLFSLSGHPRFEGG